MDIDAVQLEQTEDVHQVKTKKVNDPEIQKSIELYLEKVGIYDVTLTKLQAHLKDVLPSQRVPSQPSLAVILKNTFHLQYKK